MSLKSTILAKKYATAYLDIFLDEISNQEILKIKDAYEFLKSNNNVIFFLSLPNISLYDKTNFINIFLTRLNLAKSLQKLIFLLMKHGRIIILKDVFKEIINVYQVKKNIMIFEISSSKPLDEKDSKIVLNFLKEKTHKTILPIYKLNEELIAGVRLQNGSFLWEKSIQNELVRVKQLLYKR